MALQRGQFAEISKSLLDAVCIGWVALEDLEEMDALGWNVGMKQVLCVKDFNFARQICYKIRGSLKTVVVLNYLDELESRHEDLNENSA